MPCGGTRGDTQPCVALAVAMRKVGHEVIFFSPTTHVPLSRDQGFETHEFKMDVEALIAEIAGQGDQKHFARGMSFWIKSMQIMKDPKMKNVFEAMVPDLWELAERIK